MTVRISVREPGVNGALRELDRLQRRVVPRATAAALNATNSKIRTRVVRHIHKTEGVKSRLVRKRVVTPRNGRANPQRLRASGVALVGFVPASWFDKTAETARGVTAGRHHVDNAFVARRKTSGRGKAVFKRKAAPRLPLREPTVELTKDIEPAVDRIVRVDGSIEFRKEFERALVHFLRRERLL